MVLWIMAAAPLSDQYTDIIKVSQTLTSYLAKAGYEFKEMAPAEFLAYALQEIEAAKQDIAGNPEEGFARLAMLQMAAELVLARLGVSKNNYADKPGTAFPLYRGPLSRGAMTAARESTAPGNGREVNAQTAADSNQPLGGSNYAGRGGAAPTVKGDGVLKGALEVALKSVSAGDLLKALLSDDSLSEKVVAAVAEKAGTSADTELDLGSTAAELEAQAAALEDAAVSKSDANEAPGGDDVDDDDEPYDLAAEVTKKHSWPDDLADPEQLPPELQFS
jgi:hypothetical protein